MCDDDDQYTNCNNAFNCGSSITNIKYPFWGENRKKYCGGVSSDPNMELTCEESVPKITINDAKYRIHDWNDIIQKLTIARDDYWSGICAVNVSGNPKNRTFDSTMFQRDGVVSSQVNLLYNCDTSIPNVVFSTTCRGNIEVVYTISDPRSVSL
ncbi:hypothetical protein MtrunA17_Chr7g0251091 [Medicago truncatula]|uniref:Serine/Threonine kinase, putative n=1 Tax=Medicago truncatula TaxID=3880 RepID=G7KV57_MEDTR|nr:Serine/Threonine kinase, putative [Medicago truncatula]RHN47266.1 hypothetical protein MtrunA17_Chr7g0251091 [Medicago truncatula]